MLGALLLLPSLLGAALAGPLPGPHDCARGPTAWCRDLRAASACGALEHCHGTVWSEPTARSLPCDVCLDVAAAAGNGLNPEATDTDALTLLMKTCEWLPSREASASCQALVAAHPSAVLSLLGRAPGSTPSPVCAALALCQPLQRPPATQGRPQEDTAEAVAPLMAPGPASFPPPRAPGGAVCRDCVRLLVRLQAALDSSLPQLVEATTREQCEALGPGLAPLCKSYVHRLLAPAEHTLGQLAPEEVCARGAFCDAPEAPARLAAGSALDGVPALELASPRRRGEMQMQAGLTCEVCLQVVQELDQWLESNSTEAMISHALERVCSFMPVQVVRQCVSLVDTYGPSLVELVARVSPEQVCTVIKLCGSRRRARSVHGAHAGHHAQATTPDPLLDAEAQGSFCNGCKRLLGVSIRNLDRKSTKHDILVAFKGGCSVLPLPYTIQCSRFVADYEPVLIASLKEMMDPDALCRKVGACHPPRAPLLGPDQCVLGPSFWCSSRERAEMCRALEHCQRHVWKGLAPPDGQHP
ncbi:Proactivator polypeptide-like 1 [Galemys pyrenaicus]|uniref:Proactivator polypeptide-like 1 n=1 Tax=Galemys pyrenaicus TaxID=202257 RepID=A0A8J5ZZA4_GALPY|nr:Proactivator polypeptide-like 1 [Galemys pyrenaicus]